MRIVRTASAVLVIVAFMYTAHAASAKSAPTHQLRGIVDVAAEPIDPPTEGDCGAALLDDSKTNAQTAKICQNDPAYNQWIADTTKGAPCTSSDATVDEGTSVVIRSKAGKTFGVTQLSSGTLVKDQGETCRFQFTQAVGDAPKYEIVIGGANPVTLSKSQLQRHGWLAPLHYQSS